MRAVVFKARATKKDEQAGRQVVAFLPQPSPTQPNATVFIVLQRLCAMAQEWAEFLVEEVCLSNSGFTLDGLRLGENISSRWSNGELEESGKN